MGSRAKRAKGKTERLRCHFCGEKVAWAEGRPGIAAEYASTVPAHTGASVTYEDPAVGEPRVVALDGRHDVLPLYEETLTEIWLRCKCPQGRIPHAYLAIDVRALIARARERGERSVRLPAPRRVVG